MGEFQAFSDKSWSRTTEPSSAKGGKVKRGMEKAFVRGIRRCIGGIVVERGGGELVVMR